VVNVEPHGTELTLLNCHTTFVWLVAPRASFGLELLGLELLGLSRSQFASLRLASSFFLLFFEHQGKVWLRLLFHSHVRRVGQFSLFLVTTSFRSS